MIETIALNKLVPSPNNVRKRSDAVADAQLKADIAARGLLQNLLVRKAKRGLYEVEAGGRRLAALKALADEGAVAKNLDVVCLVLEGDEGQIREAGLAENFQRLAMNPADEAQAFAAIIGTGVSVEDVANRFGVTARFVEGRLRLSSLAPCVFAALAEGSITLDVAKAYGATSDIVRQEQVFEELKDSYYQANADTVRRMMTNSAVRGDDPRALLVGRTAYEAAGGRIERELFDDDATESWLDVSLLESLADKLMASAAADHCAEQGLAWVKPTLDCYVSHDMIEGLVRLPAEAAPLTDDQLARWNELETAYDGQAAILENEDSSEAEVEAAERALSDLDAEMRILQNRPPVLADDLKAGAGAILVLGRDGAPKLIPQFYTAKDDRDICDGALEPVDGTATASKTSALSQRLLDELSMQRRDVLAVHLASNPALALDVLVFSLADADHYDAKAKPAIGITGPAATGPIAGFEAKDAPASAALAELAADLDQSWRSGPSDVDRFAAYRQLDDAARSQWLGHVVARTLMASLQGGARANAMHDVLGSLMGISMAGWWRPTAANYFDRVPKMRILEALDAVGGPDLVSRYAGSKKADLANAAERIFAGNFIAEAGVKERALDWVPPVMAFGEGDVSASADADAPQSSQIVDQAA